MLQNQTADMQINKRFKKSKLYCGVGVYAHVKNPDFGGGGGLSFIELGLASTNMIQAEPWPNGAQVQL